MSDFEIYDGFGYLPDGTQTAGVDTLILGSMWSSFWGNFAVEDIGDGTKWIKPPTAANAAIYLTTQNLGGLATLSIAFHVRPTSRDGHFAIVFLDGTNKMGYLGINSSGQVYYAAHDTWGFGTQRAKTAAIPLNTVTHVEAKITFHNSAGAVAIRINGVDDSSETGIDTIYSAGSSCDNIICLGGLPYYGTEQGYLPSGWKWTCPVIHTAAAAVGDVRAPYKAADEDGTDTDFTPSSGSEHYPMVDDIGADEDATDVESDGTVGHRDSYKAPTASGVQILSQATLCRARKTDAGAASLLLGAAHGGSEDQSSAKALSEDYLTLFEPFDTNPSTAAAWTPAEVDAAEITIEVGA